MFRAIREYFRPTLKCTRVGHAFVTDTFRVRKRAKGYAVVEDFEAIQRRCNRCGFKDEVIVGDKIDWFNSCSMPNSMWRDMDKNGFVIMEKLETNG